MEKNTPHYKLPAIKSLVAEGKVKATYSALTGAAVLGLDFQEMIEVVAALTISNFHKSMTTHADHRVWQDVYRPNTSVGVIYLKLTVIEDLLIVSFKEL